MSENHSHSSQNQTKKKVLIVADLPQVGHDLRQLLELTGWFEIVAEAGNPDEAVRQALLLAPDAVLVDLQMSRLVGYEATRLIKANLPALRVIVLSAYAGHEEMEHARAAGADDRDERRPLRILSILLRSIVQAVTLNQGRRNDHERKSCGLPVE
jgi:CheY-like chemotaxis protein